MEAGTLRVRREFRVPKTLLSLQMTRFKDEQKVMNAKVKICP